MIKPISNIYRKNNIQRKIPKGLSTKESGKYFPIRYADDKKIKDEFEVSEKLKSLEGSSIIMDPCPTWLSIV